LKGTIRAKQTDPIKQRHGIRRTHFAANLARQYVPRRRLNRITDGGNQDKRYRPHDHVNQPQHRAML